jgi:hypothetical protein
MQTVSAEDIERRFPTKASKKDKSIELEIPKL